MVLFAVLICLHAVAMSEHIDNTVGRSTVYGFSPDRTRWYDYAIDPDDTIYLYDAKSVLKDKNNNKIIKVWVKFGEPMDIGNPVRQYKEATALKELDCALRLIRTVEGYYFSMKDEYFRFPSSKNWENIEPETADDALLEAVCPPSKKSRKR